MSSCIVYCNVHMCVFLLECVLCVNVSMSSCCPSACSHGSVCLGMYVREGERGRVPGQNNEGKWIPDGLVFLFSQCCQ